jgi:tetratricopeptide (TPR) repeat protein
MLSILSLCLFANNAHAGKAACLSAVDTHTMLGTAYLNEGNCEAALREFFAAEGACKQAAKSAEVQHRIGLAYFCKDAAADAELRIQSAIALADHSFPQAHVNLSAVYLWQERWQDAAREASVALEDPTYQEAARARNNLAYANQHLGKYDEAEQGYAAVLETAPMFCPAWYGLGQLNEERRALPQAKEHFLTAAECQEDNVQYRFDAGRLAYLQGDLEAARGHLEFAVANSDGQMKSRAQDFLRAMP